jgi:hypothetical protein
MGRHFGKYGPKGFAKRLGSLSRGPSAGLLQRRVLQAVERPAAEFGQRAEFFVKGPLPGLNELLAARGTGKGKWNGYNDLKRQWGERIIAACRELPRFSRVRLAFIWHERAERRDPDNVDAAGRKLVLDGLVAAGVLGGDGWKHLAMPTPFDAPLFVKSGTPGVTVTLEERG